MEQGATCTLPQGQHELVSREGAGRQHKATFLHKSVLLVPALVEAQLEVVCVLEVRPMPEATLAQVNARLVR